MTSPITFQLVPAHNERLSALCGQYEHHLRQIESHFDVKISHRNNVFSINGRKNRSEQAERVIRSLYELTGDNSNILSDHDVHLALTRSSVILEDDEPDLVIKVRRQQIRPQNKRQYTYLKNILNYDVNFGIGPAGTGKTYLAVACAIQALADNETERILLVRPAVEAGEKLGFLPGDLEQKVDPYLRPLFDALNDMLGVDRVSKLIQRRTIELAPLAYMRGRTLNESWIILDEAQNTTIEQMKMFLTRIGFGSHAIITGDTTQIDLPKDVYSGLKHAEKILTNVKDISFTRFKPQDVVRHPLVQRIVEAYEKAD